MSIQIFMSLSFYTATDRVTGPLLSVFVLHTPQKVKIGLLSETTKIIRRKY